MTVCDEWMRQKRRAVNVRHCTTGVSERKKRENEHGRQRRKEGMGVCGGGVVRVCVCVYVWVVAHELHTKAPTCTLPLCLCPDCQACSVCVYLCVCVCIFVCALACVLACVCKAEIG